MEPNLFSPNNQNFLSPIGFKFILGRTPNVDYFCQSASIPQVEIGVREITTPVKEYSLPGDKMTFGDLNLRFLVNEDLDNYYEIYKWLKGLTNPKHQKNFATYIASVDEKGRPEEFDRMMSDARLLILNSNYLYPNVQMSKRPNVWTSARPDLRTSGPPDVRTFGRSDVWTFGQV